jgi:hypothetical protein
VFGRHLDNSEEDESGSSEGTDWYCKATCRAEESGRRVVKRIWEVYGRKQEEANEEFDPGSG